MSCVYEEAVMLEAPSRLLCGFPLTFGSGPFIEEFPTFVLCIFWVACRYMKFKYYYLSFLS